MSDVHRTPSPFLAIFLFARLRTGLSSVWCFKQKKSLKTPVKNKGRCPCLSHRYKHETNKHKEHNSLGTDKMSVRLTKTIKKTYNRWWERMCLSSDQQVLFLFPLEEEKTKQIPREDPLSVSVFSYISMSIVNAFARRNEGICVMGSILPDSTFTVSAQGDGRRTQGKMKWWGG